MAELTLKLIWYRLSESGLDMASALLGLFGELDVLNALLLGWMLFAGLVFSAVTVYQRAVEARKASAAGLAATPTPSAPQAIRLPLPLSSTVSATLVGGGGGGSAWISSVASWLHAHHAGAPRTAEAMLLALTEESRRLADDMAISFDSVISGDAFPRVTAVTAEGSSSMSTLVLNARVELQELRIAVRISGSPQQISDAMQPERSILYVQRLDAKVKVELSYGKNDELAANVRCEEDCVLQTRLEKYELTKTGGNSSQSSPRAITAARATAVDSNRLQKHLQQILLSATIRLRFPGLTCEMVMTSSPLVQQQSQAVSSGPPKPPRTPPKSEVSTDGKLQLMIKLRKATGLGAPNAGVTSDRWIDHCARNTSPYCRIELDYPPQVYTTSVALNTVNPYWDEHFLFHISLGSKAVKFSIFDKEKKPPDDFLGQAILDLDKVRTSNPGGTQVLPLTETVSSEYSRRVSSCVSGSITVEMHFVEASADEAGQGCISATAAIPAPPLSSSSVQPMAADKESAVGAAIGASSSQHDQPVGHHQSHHQHHHHQPQSPRHAGVASSRGSPAAGAHAASSESGSRLSSSGRAHGSDRLPPGSGVLQRSRSSIIRVDSSPDGDMQPEWNGDTAEAAAAIATAASLGHDDSSSSIGRSDTDILHSLDFSNAEVVIVSSEQMSEVAVRELRRQLKHPGVSGSRTSTVVITSVHKEPITKVGDEPYGRNADLSGASVTTTTDRPPSDGANSAGESKERKSRLSAFKRHFSKSKDKKARSHSIERSTDIDSSLSTRVSPDRMHDGAALAPFVLPASGQQQQQPQHRHRHSAGSGLRKLFASGRHSDIRRSAKNTPRQSGSLPRLSGFEPQLHSTGTLATAVVVASGSACESVSHANYGSSSANATLQ